ncbi:rhodanese-like domain-containing protein [Nitrospinota bacterium]
MEAIDLIFGEENLIIIDVREPHEFICERIPEAINIPFEEIEVKTVQILKGLNQPILIYSRKGDLGALAGHVLKKIGYTNVNNLAGGLESWVGPREKLPAGDPEEVAEKVPFQAASGRGSVHLGRTSRPAEPLLCSGAIPRKEASSTRRFMTA